MANSFRRSLKEILRIPIQFFRRCNAKDTLQQLTAHGNPKLRSIGLALQETLTRNLTIREREAISLIEQRRSTLLDSEEKIDVVDYGAGSPGSNRTKEEMDKGVHSTALVADITEASKPEFWATVLFQMIRKLEPLSCVELGTCVGISASYQAMALNINGRGAIVTLEGSPEIARIAKESFENLGIENASVVSGPFHQTLSGALDSSKPIDFFFNDGHHDPVAVIQYFNESMPYLADAAVIVFDDISWSKGMRKAWTDIEEDERVSVSIDLHTMGIALVEKNPSSKTRFRIPL